MSLGVGARLGHYAVTAKLGEGGMGEVWRATDTQLNRDVALKILPEAFATDPDRLARFQREAQVLASLNHPNIAQIHGIEEQDGTRALVLELVEGPTLADRISKGPIPLDEALPIAKQIAEALEAAHEAGVIHRDLKPANIKVREDGTVKVLDFGLAKALDPNPGGDPSQSPTLTAAATQMGVIMGTAAYMSPEQASGTVVDKRADIWSFGVVLFEMLIGSRAFTGETVSHVLAAVLNTEPDWKAVPESCPHLVRRLIRRCLVKDRKERLHDIADARLEIAEALRTLGTASTEAVLVLPLQVWQRPIPLAVGILLLLVITGLAVWNQMGQEAPAPRPLARFLVNTPPDGPLSRSSPFPEVAISPDGTRVVYAAQLASAMTTRRLYLRPIDQLTATRLPGTEVGNASFFSPDGQRVGFRDAGNTLKSVSVLGGPVVIICQLVSLAAGMSWGPDDFIVFATFASKGLMRVPAVGGEPEVLTSVGPEQDETDHFWPEVLPNGKGVLFTAWSGASDTSRLAVVSLDTGAISYLLPGGSNPRYSPTGHIVYGVGSTLWAIGFDAERLELTSHNPVPVVEDVNTKASGAANFGLSSSGALVYVPASAADVAASELPTLVWVNREGEEDPLSFPPRDYRFARISPDGTRLAVQATEQGNTDVWISELARGTFTRLTTDPATDFGAIWTLDGEDVVFASNREAGGIGLFRRASDGTGAVEHLTTVEGSRTLLPRAWSPDGRQLIFSYTGTSSNIGVLSLEEEPSWEPLLQSEANERRPTISPNGEWIAYASDQSGQEEIYVERFPQLGQRQQVSTGGGAGPRWSPDGRELIYASATALFAVPIGTEPTLQVGSPEMLFQESHPLDGGRGFQGISPDGQRFLFIRDAQTDDTSAPAAEIVVVQNWTEELKRLVPTN